MTLHILSLIISICLFLSVISMVLLVMAMQGNPNGTEPTIYKVSELKISYISNCKERWWL